MDLIDRDVLKDFLCKACTAGVIDSSCDYSFDGCEIIEIINQQHTIDAEPVVHGWWCDWSMFNEPEYECSECNGISKKMYDYCPHCGAKMGGD